MITETETKALQLAKKVFEHFTHDALPIAKEILALGFEINQGPNGKVPANGGNDILNGPKLDVVPAATPINGTPVSKMAVDLPAGIMMEPSVVLFEIPGNGGEDSVPF